MQIQVNTDRNIEGSATMAGEVETAVREALDRFREKITWIEVHLSDENSNKKGGNDDIRCLLEATLAGLPRAIASEQAATWEQAVHGAAGKLKNALETTFGRLENHRQNEDRGGR
ncbi:MAG: HPF/RaiA family ribosome-associated protein [Chloroflexi bacterium]|nr:HPF/RaiA family ribosome-associated protein [Chloroflexota bacterium]